MITKEWFLPNRNLTHVGTFDLDLDLPRGLPSSEKALVTETDQVAARRIAVLYQKARRSIVKATKRVVAVGAGALIVCAAEAKVPNALKKLVVGVKVLKTLRADEAEVPNV